MFLGDYEGARKRSRCDIVARRRWAREGHHLAGREKWCRKAPTHPSRKEKLRENGADVKRNALI